MQQFTVPQFIDIEAKIIGPITTRQFIIMLACVAIDAIAYKIFDFSLFVTVSLISLVVIGLFGFTKINGRPFHFFILNFTQTSRRTKKRVWNNAAEIKPFSYSLNKDASKSGTKNLPEERRYTESRLTELSLIVDTGGAYRGEKNANERPDIQTAPQDKRRI